MKSLCLKAVIIIAAISTFSTDFAHCFDNWNTHPDITKKSITAPNLNNLNSYLVNSLGFTEGVRENIKENTLWFPATKPVIEWIMKGSTDEDIPSCRASTHFHNPRMTWDKSYLTDAPDVIAWWCSSWPGWPQYSNITWATGYTSLAEESYESRPRQDMGWDNARTYFYQALTATSSNDRNDNFIKAFRAVGQVLHMLQDLAVPAHVRNDFQSHLIFQKLNWKILDSWANPFEYYVKTIGKGLITDAEIKDTDKPTFATNPRVTDFWDTTDTFDSGGSMGPGLAEITNRGYFSNSTIPGNDNPSTDKFYAVHTFPLPQTTGTYDCKDTLPRSGVKSRYVSREPCPTIPDGKVDHFVAYSFLTSEEEIKALTANPNKRKYVIDNNVHNTYATQLLPKAIGYSAAVLDYFFRGKIKLEMVGNDTSNSLIHLMATNETANNEQMPDGEVSLVLRYRMTQANDQTSTILELGDYNYKVFRWPTQAAIPAGTGTEFTFDISADPLPDWANDVTVQLVYKGQLGSEVGAVAVGSLPIKVTPKAILISLPDSGAYAVSDGTQPFNRITLKAKTELTNGLNVAGGVFQLILIHRFSATDPYQGTEVATLPANQNSYYAIRATEMNGINSLATGVATEMTFDISATPVPLTASDVHIYLAYKANQNDPDTSALAVGYLDISEPTPIDIYNNTDKVCLNSQWYDAGSAGAMAFVNLIDVYPHLISNIYYKPGSDSTAGSGNFLLSSTTPLEPGSGRRLGYILSDYYFSQSMSETVTNLDSYDYWVLSYGDLPISADGFVNQHNMGNMQGYSGMYNMRGYKMHGGAGVVYDNQEYPEGVNCSWDLLNQPPAP